MRQGREGADAAQLFLDKDFRPVPHLQLLQTLELLHFSLSNAFVHASLGLPPTAAADVGIITHFIK